jgi:RimK family alpha-L-glutamate ligase
VLRIGIISAYHGEDWHAQRIAAAAARHHAVDVVSPTDFAGEVRVGAPRVTVRGADAADWDVWFTPRALGDDGDPDVQLELYRLLSATGTRLCNDVAPLLLAIDKLRTSWELARLGLPTPEVRVVQTFEQAEAALAALGDTVVKPVYGSLGIGVERLRAGDRARARHLLQIRGALYLQRYVDDAELDVRAFVVGDRVGAAVARTSATGELASNAARGGAVRPIDLDETTAQLAVRATRAIGLDYAGVDLMVGARGAQVLEVNGTPSFRALWEATGRDMAVAIVDHAVGEYRLMQTG